MPKKIDPEMAEFEAALLRSVDQAVSGKGVRTHTPEEIKARRGGRPLGSRAEIRKEPTTIRFDPDVLAALRATGPG